MNAPITPPFLETFPRVFQVGVAASVSVQAPGGLAPGQECKIRISSRTDRSEDRTFVTTISSDRTIVFDLSPRCPGQHNIAVSIGDAPVLAQSRIYALEPDLFALRPFKGDLHLHTNRSDGKATPAEMALALRKTGMDFVAISDHDVYFPGSPQDLPAFHELGLAVIPGEEVTIRYNCGHLLSLGAKRGISTLRTSPEGRASFAALKSENTGKGTDAWWNDDRVAETLWSARAIREQGGLLFLAHPCWENWQWYPLPIAREFLLDNNLCDGVELMGGSPNTQGNLSCLALWAERGCTGRLLGVSGGSDAHAVTEVSKCFTIAFATENAPEALLDALRSGKTLACDTLLGPDLAIFGPSQLVEYAYFLTKEYYPLHDALCTLTNGGKQEIDELSKRFWYSPKGE